MRDIFKYSILLIEIDLVFLHKFTYCCVENISIFQTYMSCIYIKLTQIELSCYFQMLSCRLDKHQLGYPN